MLYTYRHPSFEYLSWEDLEILIKDLETNDNTKEEVYINEYNLEGKILYYNDTGKEGLLIKTSDNNVDILNINSRTVKITKWTLQWI